MIHKKTTTREILGHIEPCIFKKRFHYEPCRSCNYSKPCENYKSINNYNGRKSPSVEKSVEIQNYEPSNGVVDKDTRIPPTVDFSSTHSDSYNHQQNVISHREFGGKAELGTDSLYTLKEQTSVDELILRNKRQIKKNNKILNKPFFWYHSSIHEPILPRRNYRTLIWRVNDGGCI